MSEQQKPTFEDTPFPYSLAGKWDSVVRALAIIESSEDPLKWGDGHQALGLLQQHPAHFLQFGAIALRHHEITVHTTWEEAWIVCCAAFLDEMEREHMPLEHAIWAHNLGVEAVKVEGKTDPVYWAKYKAALASFGGVEP